MEWFKPASMNTGTPEGRSRNYWVSLSKKTKEMANRSLNFEAANGNWWRPCNHERKLSLDWIHWSNFLLISRILLGKYGWKTVESHAIGFFLITYSGGNFWCPWPLNYWNILEIQLQCSSSYNSSYNSIVIVIIVIVVVIIVVII